MLSRKRTALLTLLLGASGVLWAGAQAVAAGPPAQASSGHPPAGAKAVAHAGQPEKGKQPGKAEKPEKGAKPEKAGKPEKAEKPEKPEKGEKGQPGQHEPTQPAAEGRGEPGAGRAPQAQFKSALADVRERYRQGKLKKGELKQELEALEKSRGERRKQHHRALQERWGDGLAQPASREELRHHERRMARLNRMLLLAETERTGKDRDKLVPRIEKLIAHENERHERKMNQLQTQAEGTPAARAVQPETPSAKAAGAAPVAEKGAAK